jgi:hypothetical protein
MSAEQPKLTIYFFSVLNFQYNFNLLRIANSQNFKLTVRIVLISFFKSFISLHTQKLKSEKP